MVCVIDVAKGISENCKNLDCLKFAKQLGEELRNYGMQFKIVMLLSDNPRGYICIKEDRILNGVVIKADSHISQTRKHVGILYEGKVHDNIYWDGVAYDKWVSKFYGGNLWVIEITNLGEFEQYEQ